MLINFDIRPPTLNNILIFLSKLYDLFKNTAFRWQFLKEQSNNEMQSWQYHTCMGRRDDPRPNSGWSSQTSSTVDDHGWCEEVCGWLRPFSHPLLQRDSLTLTGSPLCFLNIYTTYIYNIYIQHIYTTYIQHIYTTYIQQRDSLTLTGSPLCFLNTSNPIPRTLPGPSSALPIHLLHTHTHLLCVLCEF